MKHSNDFGREATILLQTKLHISEMTQALQRQALRLSKCKAQVSCLQSKRALKVSSTED